MIAFLAFFAGTEVGIQGYASLSQIGVAKFSAFISAYFNTREVAPLVSSIALAATVGCGYTARLGAMRISEEIDALEVMGDPVAAVPGHHPDDRGLRRRHPALHRGAVRVVPLAAADHHAASTASRRAPTTTTSSSSCRRSTCSGRSASCCSSPTAIILIHCYYGYTASGGPAGVGMAVGRAIRTSIVTVVVADFFLSFAIWGSTTTVRITGSG